MPNLDAARRYALSLWQSLEGRCIMHLGGGGIARRPTINHVLHSAAIIEIDICGRRLIIQKILVTEDFALARIGQNDELMAQTAANRAGVGAHWNSLQAHALERAQIGHEHLGVGMLGALGVDVERIGVLHQEFARAHHAKARAHLVAELPLDMIEVERQVFIGAHIAPENLRHHLFIGGAEQHFALMPVLDAQHFLTVIIVAPAFAP